LPNEGLYLEKMMDQPLKVFNSTYLKHARFCNPSSGEFFLDRFRGTPYNYFVAKL
jgi:hypothetical protein